MAKGATEAKTAKTDKSQRVAGGEQGVGDVSLTQAALVFVLVVAVSFLLPGCLQSAPAIDM